jgi:branched-chain amino acid transport system substrate-binding protein
VGKSNTALAATVLTLLVAAAPASAQDSVKVGLVLSLTGPFAQTGGEIQKGAALYMREHGDTVAGKKIELITKDDTGRPDITRRMTQELAVDDKVDILAGFGLTPLALAGAPIATEAKKLMVAMGSATTIVTEKSPYIVRTFATMPQSAIPMGEWAGKHGIKTVVILVSDYGPGLDASKAFSATFAQYGGKVLDELHAPLQNPDFAPFLQRVVDDHPDAVFLFVPSDSGGPLMKQAAERGIGQAGIKLIGTGDVLDDSILNTMGDSAIGFISAHWYSADHQSPENKSFTADFEKIYHERPGYLSVSGYDGMRLIYAALDKTKGDTSADALLAAAKGMKWDSPRGPMEIDPQTREPTQNIYIRKVEKVNGQLYNVEFETVPMVKAPHQNSN